MINRLIRAVRLEPEFYREIAGNPDFTTESFLIAVFFSVVPPLSQLLQPNRPLLSFIAGAFNNFVLGWLVWALIANFVGATFYHGKSNPGAMLRVLGYASVPRILDLLSFIPCAGWAFHFVGWLLTLVAGIIAIRECMDFDTNQAVITSLVGLVLYILANLLIGILLGGLPLPFLR